MSQTKDMTLNLSIDGMHCGSCVGRVEKAVKAVPGVQDIRVDLPKGAAHIRYQADATVDAILKAIDVAGYEAKPTET